MTDQTTPEALTDDQLRAYRECLSDAMHRHGDLYLTTDAPHDMLRLLDEVDRLRAQLDQARTESLTLGVSLAETIQERQQLRTRLADAEQTRRAALAVAADLTEDLAEARAHEPATATGAPDPDPSEGPAPTGLPGAAQGPAPLTLAQAATSLHDWAGELADGARTDWPAGHPDIIHGIRAAAEWLDARDRYETEAREQHLTALREAGRRLGESFQQLGESIRDGAAKARAAREAEPAEPTWRDVIRAMRAENIRLRPLYDIANWPADRTWQLIDRHGNELGIVTHETSYAGEDWALALSYERGPSTRIGAEALEPTDVLAAARLAGLIGDKS